MNPDGALLRRYAERGDEEAFAELVRRHLGLVYGAALRQIGGDAHRAEEIAQVVFTDLARRAGPLAERPVLASWLHTSTRYAAAKLRRAEARRWKHEQEAGAMKALLREEETAAEWARLRPVIDDAVQDLGESDREAVLQRFFANRGFAEIGAALGVSEDAARMRVERALEKLRTLLARRGLTSTGAALGLALEAHAASLAPAGLASVVAGQATACGVALAGAATASVVSFMSVTKLTLGVAAALGAVALVGTHAGMSRWRETDEARLQTEKQLLAAALAQLPAMREQALAAEVKRDVLRGKVDVAKAAAAKAKAVAKRAAESAAAAERDPFAAGDAYMQRHPEVREALGVYGRARMNFRFTELYARLKLTPEQIAQFQDLAYNGGMGATAPDGSEIQLMWGNSRDWGKTNEQLHALLGDEGMRLYQEIRDREESQTLAVRIAGGLWFTETPLTPAQSDRLVEVFQRNPKSDGQTRSGTDWDGAMLQAKEFLAPAQLAMLESERAYDRLDGAVAVKTPVVKSVTPVNKR